MKKALIENHEFFSCHSGLTIEDMYMQFIECSKCNVTFILFSCLTKRGYCHYPFQFGLELPLCHYSAASTVFSFKKTIDNKKCKCCQNILSLSYTSLEDFVKRNSLFSLEDAANTQSNEMSQFSQWTSRTSWYQKMRLLFGTHAHMGEEERRGGRTSTCVSIPGPSIPTPSSLPLQRAAAGKVIGGSAHATHPLFLSVW